MVSVAFVALTMLVAVGCGTEGSPVAEKTPAPTKETAFDPCSIPDDAIAAAGLDPSTEIDDIGPDYSVSEANICLWDGAEESSWFSVKVFYSWQTNTGLMRQHPGFQDFRDVRVNDRDGLQFRFSRTDPLRGCIMSFDLSQGLVTFDLETIGGMTPLSETCVALTRVVSDLADFVPFDS